LNSPGIDPTRVTKHKDGVRYVFNVEKKKFSVYRNSVSLELYSKGVSDEIQKFGEEILEVDHVSEEIKKKVAETLGIEKKWTPVSSTNHALDANEAVSPIDKTDQTNQPSQKKKVYPKKNPSSGWNDISSSKGNSSIPDQPIRIELPIVKNLGPTRVTKHKDGVRYVFNVEEKRFAAYRNRIPLDIDSQEGRKKIQKFGEEILKSEDVSEEIKKQASEALKIEKKGSLSPSSKQGLNTSESIPLANEVQDFVQKELGTNFTTDDVQEGLGLPPDSSGLLLSLLFSIPGIRRQKDGSWTKDLGGIDLNPDNMSLRVQGDEIKFNYSGENAHILDTIPIDGFVPMIINVLPISNIPFLLGEMEDEGNSDFIISKNF